MSVAGPQPRPRQASWSANGPMILAAALLTRAANFGLVSILARYLSDRGLSTTTIGAALAASGLATAACQGVWAVTLRRWGTSGTAIVAALLSSAGCVLLAFYAQPISVVAADAVISAGFAGMGTAARTIAGTENKDQAETESRFGKLSSAQTVGGLVGPLVLGSFALRSSAATPWFTAALCVLVLLLWVVIAARAPAAPPAADSPDQPADGADDSAGTGMAVGSVWSFWWSMRFVLLCTLGSSVLYGGNAVLWGIYLKSLGASPALTSWSFATFSLPMVFLSPVAGRLWGRFPRRLAVALGVISLGAMGVVYGLVSVTPLAVALTLVEGSLMAMTMPIMSSYVALILPSSQVGRGFALWGAADRTADVAGTAATGVLIAIAGIPGTWYSLGGFCIACSVAAVLSARRTVAAAPDEPATVAGSAGTD